MAGSAATVEAAGTEPPAVAAGPGATAPTEVLAAQAEPQGTARAQQGSQGAWEPPEAAALAALAAPAESDIKGITGSER